MERANLFNHYKENVIKNLMSKGSFKNIMQVPELKKIVVNVGAGKAIGD
ncbi:MAG TPA: 50S ribosomal protein L5, partial [Fusobacteria bacterium]|nr:50S ribosomal protein L5 [Fusobacteriota bacterium]